MHKKFLFSRQLFECHWKIKQFCKDPACLSQLTRYLAKPSSFIFTLVTLVCYD